MSSRSDLFGAEDAWGRLGGDASTSVRWQALRAMAVVAALTLVAKCAVGARDIALARRFGTADSLDAFLIAFVVPLFAVSVIALSFTSAFIPTYVAVRRREGEQAAAVLLAGVQLFTFVLLVGVAVLLLASFPLLSHLLAADFRPAKLALTRRLFTYLVPIIPLSGMSTIWTGALNAREYFAWPAAAPMVTPLVPVVYLIARPRPTIGMFAGLTTIGYTCEVLLLGWVMWKTNLLVLPRWSGWSPDLRQVVSQYVPVVAGSLILGSSPLIDQAMAATLGSGKVSALNYGMKATSFALGVGAIALSTVVLPHFSRIVVERRWPEARSVLRSYATMILVVTIPVVIIGAALSRPLVTVVFERGRFTRTDTGLVSAVQAAFLLQLPFYLLGILMVRLISSFRANHYLLWGALLSTTCNVVFNALLMRWIGVTGIALSTTLVYLATSVYLVTVALRLLRTAEDS